MRVSLWHDRGMPAAECCVIMLDTVCGFFAELSGVFVIVTVILRKLRIVQLCGMLGTMISSRRDCKKLN